MIFYLPIHPCSAGIVYLCRSLPTAVLSSTGHIGQTEVEIAVKVLPTLETGSGTECNFAMSSGK